MKPLVSICCVTFNHEKFITEALWGFLKQETNFQFEIIIHDDASTDKTTEIIKKYETIFPDIIKPIYQKENQYSKGQKVTAIAMAAAKGKYIAICEGDDYWTDPHKLQRQIDFLEKNPSVAICFHMVNVVDENGSLIKQREELSLPIFYDQQSIFHIHVPPLATVFRNVPLNFPPQFRKVFNGDAFLFGMLSSFGGAVNLGFIGAHYRKHRGGIYSKNSIIDNQIRSLNTRRAMLESNYFDKAQKKEIRLYIKRRKWSLIKNYIRAGKLSNILKVLLV